MATSPQAFVVSGPSWCCRHRHYVLNDAQGSVVALLTAAGYLAERIRYTPYGDAVVRANYGDLDDSGFVNAADFNALAGVYLSTMKDNPTVYILNADFDADGKINAGDFNILAANFATSAEPAAGALSTVGNTIGYAGYVWDPALGGNTSGLYLARNRWYSPNLGRWANRDPIGFAGGDMNLYGYVGGMPGIMVDPQGQFWHIIGGAAVGAIVGAIVAAFDPDVSLVEGVLVGAAAGAVGAATFGAVSAGAFTGGALTASGLLGVDAGASIGLLTAEQAIACGAAGGLASGLTDGVLSEVADVVLPKNCGCPDGSFDLRPIGESAGWGLVTGPIGGWLGDMDSVAHPFVRGFVFEELNSAVRWLWNR